MKVTALAGGVGGARLANGLSKILSADQLSIIVNTGDDFIYSGLYICPDIDTVTYTLAGINNPVNGWGRRNETWNVIGEIEKLNSQPWFNLGDKDLATHLERSRLFSDGNNLTDITKILAERQNVYYKIIPMTNSPVRTLLRTTELGVLPFQEYFVKYRFEPVISSIVFDGIKDAVLTNEVAEALTSCDLIIICPSNPLVSIYPILGVPGVEELICKKPTISVSPLIGSRTIKGPAAKMFQELGIQPSATVVAGFYKGLINAFVMDAVDVKCENEIRQWGIIPFVTDILMQDDEAQVRLAKDILEIGYKLIQ